MIRIFGSPGDKTAIFTIHLDGSRVAVTDAEADARRWVQEQPEDANRFSIYEYLGGNPNQRESYREVK